MDAPAARGCFGFESHQNRPKSKPEKENCESGKKISGEERDHMNIKFAINGIKRSLRLQSE